MKKVLLLGGLIVVFLSLLFGGWELRNAHPLDGASEIVATFDVYAQENVFSSSGTALDTGIDVHEGDVVEITVAPDDMWNIGEDVHSFPPVPLGSSSAEGFVDYARVDPGIGVSYPFGALAGSIGDGLNLFLIGTHSLQTMDKHGRLYLLCWDDVPDDNSGFLTVAVKVRKQQN